jgi:hypothetical protein
MIKTNKRGAILVVSLWAVLGAVLYHDIQELRAERRVDRLTQLQYKIVHESEPLRRAFWNRGSNRWEKLKRAKCKDVQGGGLSYVRRSD